jgi:hypothetical protein
MTIGSADNGFVAFDLAKGRGAKPSMLRAAGKFTWETPIESPAQAEAIMLTGNYLLAAGTTNRRKRDKAPAFLFAYDIKDGRKAKEIVITAPPVYDGFAAADGRFYLATADGKLTCYGRKN